MTRKKKIVYHSYTSGNIRYMSCQVCGRYESVGDETTAVKCGRCTNMMMIANFPDEDKSYKPTGRPVGWHWMSEFVDKDGNVFHKGKELPKLKGTLKPTKVKPRKKNKITRRTKDQILVEKYKEKQKLKRELKKQQDFLNHNIDKG